MPLHVGRGTPRKRVSLEDSHQNRTGRLPGSSSGKGAFTSKSVSLEDFHRALRGNPLRSFCFCSYLFCDLTSTPLLLSNSHPTFGRSTSTVTSVSERHAQQMRMDKLGPVALEHHANILYSRISRYNDLTLRRVKTLYPQHWNLHRVHDRSGPLGKLVSLEDSHQNR